MLGNENAIGGCEFGSEDQQPAHASVVLARVLNAAGVRSPQQTADKLLARFTIRELLCAEPLALQQLAGAEAARVLPAIAGLLRAWAAEPVWLRPLAPVGSDLEQYLQLSLGYRTSESLLVLYLNSAHRLLHIEESQGGLLGVEICIPRILKTALAFGAVGIIVAHNHPSGDPRASVSDAVATRRLVNAARHLDIKVYDHLIVAAGRITSVIYG